MNIHEVLEYGAIIGSHDEYDSVITWNGSATFNWFVFDATRHQWTNTDVRTVYEVDELWKAERVAREWIEEVENEGNED